MRMGLGITLWTILPVVEPLKAMISVDMELRTDLKVRSLGSMLWESDKRTTLSCSIGRDEHSNRLIYLIQPQTYVNLECHFVKDLVTHGYLKLPNGLGIVDPGLWDAFKYPKGVKDPNARGLLSHVMHSSHADLSCL